MFRPTPSMLMRPTSRMFMQPTRRMLNVSESAAGTTKIHFQRLRAIPVEVYPLGVIVGFMVSYGIFAMTKAITVGDPTLRNHRQPAQHNVWEDDAQK